MWTLERTSVGIEQCSDWVKPRCCRRVEGGVGSWWLPAVARSRSLAAAVRRRPPPDAPSAKAAGRARRRSGRK